ncbi:hypothetical protein J2W35_005400 [Variovorax boronicumulans]|nr:hypothetical protein [Variovorax boronicumulans]
MTVFTFVLATAHDLPRLQVGQGLSSLGEKCVRTRRPGAVGRYSGAVHRLYLA